ncbi:MAG: hypothetical protein HKL80_04115 [Acidimicrobiales bacterium]|nr:hypothetical protein [Acidimicrobiales bacterium]
MLECVVNISEGQNLVLLGDLKSSCEGSLLDVHSDPWHNRSVFTLAGNNVEQDVRNLVTVAIKGMDLEHHVGVHPRFGVVDVVPFINLPGTPHTPIEPAIGAREDFIKWASEQTPLSLFRYGPERTLPETRKAALKGEPADAGPTVPGKKLGAVACGARYVLIAYNLYLDGLDLSAAKEIASQLRSPELRMLGFEVNGIAQVSCNLVAPWLLGPDKAFTYVKQLAHSLGGEISKTELVGLVPEFILEDTDKDKWSLLDLSPEVTIEGRLAKKAKLG